MNLLKWSLFKNCLERFVAGEYTGKVEQTPLMPVMELAASVGDSRFLARALAHGADPDSLDVYGTKTVIFAAILHRRMENVGLLLEAGADPNARSPSLTTPLMAAVGYRNYEMACYLLDEGADPSLPNNRGHTVADRVEMFGEFVPQDQREWLVLFKEKLSRRD